jgi:hypothetical protein
MYVLSTEEDDGTATMTISIADDDHQFEVWSDGGEALVQYQESLTYRGSIEVSEPDESVYKALMTSDEMVSLLERWGVESVRRAAPTP